MDQVIVHVGCMNLKESQELARHAAQIGASGIAVIAPSFYKPSTAGRNDGKAQLEQKQPSSCYSHTLHFPNGRFPHFLAFPDVLRTFLKEIAAVAPTLPFYYYHLPAVTGVNIPVREVLQNIEELIPSFSGVKFSSSDLMDFGQCVSHSPPHWSLLYGVDEQLLAALALGAHGAVGSTYNYVGRHINNLISAFNSGDLIEARSIQFKLQELLSHAFKLGFDVGVNKQLMVELSGLPLGPPRLPVRP
ncbi:unnamed protein product, partial [Tetraodon nigroviridis]